MRSLQLRLAVALGAVAVVGLLAADLAYVFEAQAQAVARARLELRAAATGAGLAALESGTSGALAATLSTLGTAHGVELTLVGPGGTIGTPLSDAAASASPGFVASGGRETFSVILPAGSRFERAVASRSLRAPLEAVLARQAQVLFLLVVIGACMVTLAIWLLRRGVLRPLTRLSELVSARDQEAIMRFGARDDDIARLGRGILAMTQQIDDDRTRIESQLKHLEVAHADLQKARDHVVRAERLATVGRLAAGLAHEVGNPLAVLMGYVGVLREPLPEPQRLEALGRMERELSRIHATVTNLLDVSRAPSTVDGRASVADVFAQVSALLSNQRRKRAVDLSFSLEGRDVQLAIDPRALTQVLLNLVLNALDAVPEGGRVLVRAAGGDSEGQVTVEDSGPGVPLGVRPRIFDPFFTTKPAGEGTGLGLWVCDSLASAAGGSLVLEDGSELGGARFVLRLPVAADPAR